ncbi:hypothetical protein LSTR_LSTR017448 [Laodelphax striatellus]|uniref:Uncharacterized protein n=1 Tax=Laodelphax striatellus TaxID=195883 RepID=A0A482XBA9_LAOST|nr:hypothetical protein LSTR_LSTR017448 [Laodelphax striatellus]
MFNSEVQFGHAGSCANSDMETATAKNKALKEAGAVVPSTFDDLGEAIHDVYAKLVKSGVIVPLPEMPPPTVPMDFSWARVSSTHHHHHLYYIILGRGIRNRPNLLQITLIL